MLVFIIKVRTLWSFFLFILYLEARFVDFYVLLSESFSYLDERIDMLMQKCFEELKSQGFEE